MQDNMLHMDKTVYLITINDFKIGLKLRSLLATKSGYYSYFEKILHLILHAILYVFGRY